MCKKDVANILKSGFALENQVQAVRDAIKTLSLRKPATTLLINRLYMDVKEVQAREGEIKTLINHLPEGVMKDVFANRYIHKLTWEDVAERCHISLAYAHKLHKAGIDKLTYLEGFEYISTTQLV
ncbi:MAG: hypothetical protein FWE21_07565 [Defluviitaleaceae bacterium]|nr:hypothetical protein [Defluviitaleaceae bacterium]